MLLKVLRATFSLQHLPLSSLIHVFKAGQFLGVVYSLLCPHVVSTFSISLIYPIYSSVPPGEYLCRIYRSPGLVPFMSPVSFFSVVLRTFCTFWKSSQFLWFLFPVYADGSICLDILQNRWSPTYDVSAILTSIQVSICRVYHIHGVYC